MIAIKDFEMPKQIQECKFRTNTYWLCRDICFITKEECKVSDLLGEARPTWCPLVEI
ncbi:hypothetical protein AAIR98_000861 [Elusimicrobium simillimum]